HVEKLRAELQIPPLADLGVLEQREIELPGRIAAQTRIGARRVAERVRSRNGELAGVEPALRRRAVQLRTHAGPVGPLPAALGKSVIGRRVHAQWIPAVGQINSGNLPAPEHLAREAVAAAV